MSIKEQIVQELDRLSETYLEQLARYLAFLKYQARIESALAIDEQKVGALYAEFGEVDRVMAEEGLADYACSLQKEDAQ
jgi:hypothetical protein